METRHLIIKETEWTPAVLSDSGFIITVASGVIIWSPGKGMLGPASLPSNLYWALGDTEPASFDAAHLLSGYDLSKGFSVGGLPAGVILYLRAQDDEISVVVSA